MDNYKKVLLMIPTHSQADIARELKCSKNNILQYVKRLQTRGMLVKNPNQYRVTKKGREFVNPKVDSTIDNDNKGE
jgi:predicted transcriptional regulator